MNKGRVIEYMGIEFVVEYSKKFDKDLATVMAILDKGIENLTHADRVALLRVYRPAWHDSGKIEGITSYDSSATACDFCRNCRRAAEGKADHICGYCYDYAQEHSFKGVNVRNRHSLNMLIMQSVEFTREELELLECSKIDRVNSSGDTPNVTYAVNMLNIAHVNPMAHFAYWAKNVLAVQKAVEKVGKPQNMTLVQSSCILNKAVKLAEYFDIVFTVYTTKEAVDEALANGAGECNGKKCQDCGYKCYLNGWTSGQNVAEYLRVNKAQRAELEKASR